MHLSRFLLLTIGLILVSSCRTTNSDGDLAGFLMRAITSYGGKRPAQTINSVISGKWSVTKDRYGMVIRSAQIDFEQVDYFMKNTYGSPGFGGKTSEGQTQWVITAKSAGVAIWYAKEKNGVRVTINRQLNLN